MTNVLRKSGALGKVLSSAALLVVTLCLGSMSLAWIEVPAAGAATTDPRFSVGSGAMDFGGALTRSVVPAGTYGGEVGVWLPRVTGSSWVYVDPQLDFYGVDGHHVATFWGDGSFRYYVGLTGNEGGNNTGGYFDYYSSGDSNSYGWRPYHTANTVGIDAGSGGLQSVLGTWRGAPANFYTGATLNLSDPWIRWVSVKFLTRTYWNGAWSPATTTSAVWVGHEPSTWIDTSVRPSVTIATSLG